MCRKGGIQDDDRGFRREVKEDGEWGMEGWREKGRKRGGDEEGTRACGRKR